MSTMNRRTALKTAIGGMLAALWPWKKAKTVEQRKSKVQQWFNRGEIVIVDAPSNIKIWTGAKSTDFSDPENWVSQ